MVSKYEPEAFSGMVLRMKYPKLTLLIFNTGKLVITGAKSREHVFEAYEKVKSVLLRHKVQTV